VYRDDTPLADASFVRCQIKCVISAALFITISVWLIFSSRGGPQGLFSKFGVNHETSFKVHENATFSSNESAVDFVGVTIANRSISSIDQTLSTYLRGSKELRQFATAVCRDLHCFHAPAFIVANQTLSKLSSVLADCSSRGELKLTLLGDSIGAGCCDQRGGFGAGIVSGLQNLLGPDVECKFKNRSRGGTWPEYFLYCDFSDGDEDIIILEFVPSADKANVLSLEGLVRKLSLLKRSPVIILVATSSPDRHNDTFILETTELWREIANNYFLLFLDLTEAITYGLTTCVSGSMAKTKFYSDYVHPNEYGHLYAACQILGIFEAALRFSPIDNRHNYVPKAKPVSKEVEMMGITECYSVLEEDRSRWPHVVDVHNFQIVERAQAGSTSIHKRSWQGNKTGDSISFILPPFISLKVSVYVGPSDDFGVAKVSIGTKHVSILDTRRQPGSRPWIESHRGYINEFPIVRRKDNVTYDHEVVSFVIQVNSSKNAIDSPRQQMVQIIALLVETASHYDIG